MTEQDTHRPARREGSLRSPPTRPAAGSRTAPLSSRADKVQEIGAYADLAPRHPGARVVGDGSQIVMPGIIDAHSHGHGLSRIPAGVFFTFLENMILDWPWRVALPSDLAAALTAVRHLRQGFTTTHHFGWDDPGPKAIEAGDKAVRAYLKTGIRLAYTPAVRKHEPLRLRREGIPGDPAGRPAGAGDPVHRIRRGQARKTSISSCSSTSIPSSTARRPGSCSARAGPTAARRS